MEYETDLSKLFLGVVLALVVTVLVFPPAKRPLANAPLDPDAPAGEDESEIDTDAATITRGAGWIGVPNYRANSPPLMLMMPRQGGAPILPRGGVGS